MAYRGTRPLWLAVEHGFDVVPVRIQHERAVVVGMVVGAYAWSTEVLATRADRRLVERIDLGAIARRERDVNRRDQAQLLGLLEARRPLANPEVRLRVASDSATGAELHQHLHPQRGQGLFVERLRTRVVANR